MKSEKLFIKIYITVILALLLSLLFEKEGDGVILFLTISTLYLLVGRRIVYDAGEKVKRIFFNFSEILWSILASVCVLSFFNFFEGSEFQIILKWPALIVSIILLAILKFTVFEETILKKQSLMVILHTLPAIAILIGMVSISPFKDTVTTYFIAGFASYMIMGGSIIHGGNQVLIKYLMQFTLALAVLMAIFCFVSNLSPMSDLSFVKDSSWNNWPLRTGVIVLIILMIAGQANIDKPGKIDC